MPLTTRLHSLVAHAAHYVFPVFTVNPFGSLLPESLIFSFQLFFVSIPTALFAWAIGSEWYVVWFCHCVFAP